MVMLGAQISWLKFDKFGLKQTGNSRLKTYSIRRFNEQQLLKGAVASGNERIVSETIPSPAQTP